MDLRRTILLFFFVYDIMAVHSFIGTVSRTYINDGTFSGSQSTDTLNFRLKRTIPTITNPNNLLLNELAKRVLMAIDSVAIAYNDSGTCLRNMLCENNKWSRTLHGKNKLLIPMFR